MAGKLQARVKKGELTQEEADARRAARAGKPKLKEGEKVMTPKQIRARARRAGGMEMLPAADLKALHKTVKPIEEWDLEELARGRPRDKNGNFTGVAPKWVTREWHEKSIQVFKDRIRTDMQSHTVKAVDILGKMLDNTECDARGRPNVPASVKVDIAKFLLEHLIGKPTQPIQADISIKLQGILGAALVMPDQLSSYKASSSHTALEIVDAELEEEGDGSEG